MSENNQSDYRCKNCGTKAKWAIIEDTFGDCLALFCPKCYKCLPIAPIMEA